MPSANDNLITDLDSTPGTTPPTNQGLHPSTATTTGKKKKKAKKNVAKQKPWDDTSEDTPYPKSVTPSPPVEHFSGVRLSAEPTPPNSEPEPEVATGVRDEEDDAVAAWEQTPPQPPADLEPVQDADVPHPELLIEDFGDLDAGLNPPEPDTKTPSPKPPPAPSPAVTSPLTSPRPRKATLSTPQAPPSPAPFTRRTVTARNSEHDKDGSVSRPTSVIERHRKESTARTHSPVPRKSFVEPINPPHMKQNHYFAVPGLDFGRAPATTEKGGKQAGSEHYCCCFDTFGNAGDAASAVRAKDALIVGWEGGLEVYRVLADKMEIVGRLEGLRGGVVGAKILPWSGISGGSSANLPLVALIVHGPMDGQAYSPARDSEEADEGEEPTKHYQTTVEVFSLQTQEHVTTLYRSLPVALPEAKLGQYAKVPEPVGDLRLDAKGSFITIASGKSGEIFAFAQTRDGSSTSGFRCIGKYWTSLQSRFDVQSKPSVSTDSLPGTDVSEPQTSPLLSLSGRWLAYVPPNSSSRISVQGTLAFTEGQPQPPGVGAHLAPPQPPVSCDIVGLNSEGVLAKYSRQAAQEFLKASRKGIEMGMAGWREFTQPSPPTRTSQRTDAGGEEGFPPTNAPGDDTRRVAKEPAVVAIVDLERLLDAEENHAKHLPLPLATFALDDGCNFLSLSSDGLRLLTTSRMGEVSYVWDLRYAAHGSYQKRDVGDANAVMGPHVNRIQRIVRNSHSVVLDVAWARDGNFVALLTAHGTVHLHEISSRAQDSPRRRRRSTVTAPPMDKADATVSLSTGLSPPSSNGFLGGIRSGWQTMSTQVSAMRTPTTATEGRANFGIPTTFAGFREVTNAGAAASGRAIARGISQGYSAARIGAADVWHADDNKIKHKDLPNNVAERSVRWLRTRSGISVVVACGGKVYLCPVQRVTRQRGETTFSGLKAETKGRREFGLPPIATTSSAVQPAKASGCAQQGPHGFWGLRAPASTQQKAFDANAKTSQESEAEKAHYETNPPFCPLYIDRRVSMLGYNESSPTYDGGFDASDFQIKGHGLDDEQPWVFGEPLPSSTKLNDRSAVSEASISDEDEDDRPQNHDHEQLAMDNFNAEIDSAGGEPRVEDNVQSRIIINPANNEIRINSSRKKPRKLMRNSAKSKPPPPARADGDFELLEDEEDGMF